MGTEIRLDEGLNKDLYLTVRVELLPTNEQRTMLDELGKAQRIVYNKLYRFNSDATESELRKYVSTFTANDIFLSQFYPLYYGNTVLKWLRDVDPNNIDRKTGYKALTYKDKSGKFVTKNKYLGKYRTSTKHTKVIDLGANYLSVEKRDTCDKDCLVFNMPIYKQLKGSIDRQRKKEKTLYAIKLAESGRITEETMRHWQRLELFKMEDGKKGRYYLCFNIPKKDSETYGDLLTAKEQFKPIYFDKNGNPVGFDRRQRPVYYQRERGCWVTESGEGAEFYNYVPDNSSVSVQKLYTVPTIGIDVGIETLAYLSNGDTIEGVSSYEPYQKITKRIGKLVLLQKREKLYSKKFTQKINRLKRKQYYIKKNYMHTKAKELVDKYAKHCVLQMEQLTEPESNKTKISSASNMGVLGAYLFMKFVSYKARIAGGSQYVINKYYPSSKECFRCGHRDDGLQLTDRVYHCKHCGYTEVRDFNAALNIAAWQPTTYERLKKFKQRKYNN